MDLEAITRSHLYSACLLNATYYYEPGDNHPQCRATGFVAQYPNQKDWGLVTNRHVGEPVWKDPEKYDGTTLESLTAEIWLTTRQLLQYELTSIEPVLHDDPTIDVCMFPLPFDKQLKGTVILFDAVPPDLDLSSMGEAEREKTIKGLAKKYSVTDAEMEIRPEHFLTWDFLVAAEQYWHVLNVGEMAFFPGFPAWYDKSQRRPVMRSGAIMSDPQTDIRIFDQGPRPGDGNRQMLFEAFSTDGNSGSPVYVAQRGFYLGPPLSYQGVYHPLLFAGINAGHLDDAQQKHVGVSRMHKASVVLDVLRKACPSGG
jgi:hypothetical protein